MQVLASIAELTANTYPMPISTLYVWFMQAMLDARLAIEQDPKLKAHHRLAQAQLGLERFKAAMQSAQAGQRLLDIKADRTTDFTILMDQIAMAGALKADYAGFDGRILQVGCLQPSLLLAMCCFQSSAAQG